MNNNDFEKKFNDSPYINRFRYIAFIYTIAIIFSSIAISIYFSDFSLFSRSGTLVTLVGIYIAYNDLSGKIYQRLSTDSFSMSEFFNIGDLGNFSKEELNDLVAKAKEVERTRTENRQFSNYVSDKFLKMEVTLLFIGTLISGYGDLILKGIASF